MKLLRKSHRVDNVTRLQCDQPAADLAWRVERDGFAAHEPEVACLADHARFAGVSAVSLDVLTDLGAPVVARSRALGRVLRAMAGTDSPRSLRDSLRPVA